MSVLHYSLIALGYVITIMFSFGSYGRFKEMDYGRSRNAYKYTSIFLVTYLLYIVTDNLILHVR